MNESGQFGVVGALLTKAVSNSSSGRPITERETDDGGARSDKFSDFFDSAEARDRNRGPNSKDTNVVETPKRGEIIDDGPAARAAEAASTDEQNTRDDGLVGFDLKYSDHARRGENYPAGIIGLIAQGEGTQYFNPNDGRFGAGLVNGRDQFASYRQLQAGALETLKLAPSSGDDIESTLITSKLSEAARAGDPANSLDTRRGGAISFSLRPDATPGVIGRAVSAQDAFSQFEKSFAEFSLGRDRISESRSAISEAVIFTVRSSQQSQTLAGAFNPQDAYSFLGASLTTAATDSDISFDPALATQGIATRAVGGSTFAAPSIAHSFTGYSGVLPQIQAAVIAHNGRDTIEVRLDPPDLGRVRIDFNVEGGDAIRAIVGADRSETLDYLRRNIADLEQQLKQAGFGSISFEFQSRSDRQFADDQNKENSTAPMDGHNLAAGLSNKVYLSLRENARLDLLL